MPHSDMNDNGNEQWMDGHPDEGLLHEWLDEQLSAADTERVAAHVQSCAQCQEVVAEARGLIAASHRILAKLDEVPADVIPQNFAVPAPAITNSVDTKVTSIDSASARRSKPSPFRWQRVAPIAALLLVAVMYARGSGIAKKEPALVTSEPAAAASRTAVATPATSPAADAAVRSEGFAASTAPSADAVSNAPKAAEQAAMGSASIRARSSTGSGAAGGSSGRDQLAKARAADGEQKDVARKAEAAVTQEMTASAAAVAKSSAPLTTNTAEPEVAKRAIKAPPPAPSVVSTTPASPPVAARLAPPATPPPNSSADSRLRLRGAAGEVAGGARAGASAPVPEPAPPPAVTLASPPVPPLVADSIVLVRTMCATACETSTLHISALGVARLTVGTGVAERSVTAQLSTQQRASLETAVWRAARTARVRAYRCTVPQSNGDAAPAIQINVMYPAPVPAGEARCTQSASEISELAREIDAIAGTELLRQRLRQ